MPSPLLPVALPLGLLLAQAGNEGVMVEVARLRLQLASLEQALRQREEKIVATSQHVKALADELGALKELMATSTAGPFLSGPPPSSDSAGVAPVAVFGPRLAVTQTTRRHDTVFLKLRRLEASGVRRLPDVQLEADADAVELPIDQNGALYLLDWSTSEGYEHVLELRDGATGQAAASVQVKQLQNEGKFIFVGYRLE
jgi:hypothetical protein